jgi:transposase-like protein
VRRSASEKQEIIHLVEHTDLPVRVTLRQLGIAPSTFYGWYQRYLGGGFDALHDQKPQRRARWNQIPEPVRAEVVQLALQKTELSARELACHYTDERRYFLSESSVYRILKAHNLITSPAYVLLSASDAFKHPTRRVHEMWQTDFTYLRVIGWGWYYLSTVMDDFSRFIIAYLHLQCVSLHLTTPLLRCNGLVPALVAVEVESHDRRGVRRDWRRNDAMCRGAESSESPSVGLRASA